MAAHIVALEGGLGLALEKVDLKTHRTAAGADFMLINPKGYVPAVELDDGSLLTENTAILPFLGDKTRADPARRHRHVTAPWNGSATSPRKFTKALHRFSMAARKKRRPRRRKHILRRLSFIEDNLSADRLADGLQLQRRPTPICS